MANSRQNFSTLKIFFSLPNDPSKPLTRFDLIQLQNWMLIGVLLANTVAHILMGNLIFRGGPIPSAESRQLVSPISGAFNLFFGIVIVVFALIYERPIRRALNDIFHNRTTSHETIETARRRLLNEPFYMMTLNLCIWIFAGFFFAYINKGFGEPQPVVARVFLVCLNTGLITAVMSFFLLEHISQRYVARFFFPEGGLYNTSKTIRIRIVIRFLALLIACNIIPLLSFIQYAYPVSSGVCKQFSAAGWAHLPLYSVSYCGQFMTLTARPSALKKAGPRQNLRLNLKVNSLRYAWRCLGLTAPLCVPDSQRFKLETRRCTNGNHLPVLCPF